MRLLLDTHVLVALAAEEESDLPLWIQRSMNDPGNACVCGVVSLWEIAIKFRLGKLGLAVPLDALPSIFEGIGHTLLPIDERHVLAELDIDPPTRDPFDRLLLAQCQVEGMRLVTIDRALAAHPLAMR